jgi:hypothetical protein
VCGFSNAAPHARQCTMLGLRSVMDILGELFGSHPVSCFVVALVSTVCLTVDCCSALSHLLTPAATGRANAAVHSGHPARHGARLTGRRGEDTSPFHCELVSLATHTNQKALTVHVERRVSRRLPAPPGDARAPALAVHRAAAGRALLCFCGPPLVFLFAGTEREREREREREKERSTDTVRAQPCAHAGSWLPRQCLCSLAVARGSQAKLIAAVTTLLAAASADTHTVPMPVPKVRAQFL